MLSNFHMQLEVAGMSDRYEELLLSSSRVGRARLPDHDHHPFAQHVGTQAVLSVVSGKRYSIVRNEVKKYILRYYSELLAPI